MPEEQPKEITLSIPTPNFFLTYSPPPPDYQELMDLVYDENDKLRRQEFIIKDKVTGHRTLCHRVSYYSFRNTEPIPRIVYGCFSKSEQSLKEEIFEKHPELKKKDALIFFWYWEIIETIE